MKRAFREWLPQVVLEMSALSILDDDLLHNLGYKSTRSHPDSWSGNIRCNVVFLATPWGPCLLASQPKYYSNLTLLFEHFGAYYALIDKCIEGDREVCQPSLNERTQGRVFPSEIKDEIELKLNSWLRETRMSARERLESLLLDFEGAGLSLEDCSPWDGIDSVQRICEEMLNRLYTYPQTSYGKPENMWELVKEVDCSLTSWLLHINNNWALLFYILEPDLRRRRLEDIGSDFWMEPPTHEEVLHLFGTGPLILSGGAELEVAKGLSEMPLQSVLQSRLAILERAYWDAIVFDCMLKRKKSARQRTLERLTGALREATSQVHEEEQSTPFYNIRNLQSRFMIQEAQNMLGDANAYLLDETAP